MAVVGLWEWGAPCRASHQVMDSEKASSVVKQSLAGTNENESSP